VLFQHPFEDLFFIPKFFLPLHEPPSFTSAESDTQHYKEVIVVFETLDLIY
jgi:hypothetical protein